MILHCRSFLYALFQPGSADIAIQCLHQTFEISAQYYIYAVRGLKGMACALWDI